MSSPISEAFSKGTFFSTIILKRPWFHSLLHNMANFDYLAEDSTFVKDNWQYCVLQLKAIFDSNKS